MRTSTRSKSQSNRRVKCMVAVWAAGLEPPPSLSCSLSHLIRVILVDIFRRVTFVETEWAGWKLDYLTLLLLVTSIYPSNVVSWFSQIRSTWTFQYCVPQQTELTQAPLRQLEGFRISKIKQKSKSRHLINKHWMIGRTNLKIWKVCLSLKWK